MRILIAPDKFKGALSAADAARAILAGLRSVRPDCEIVVCPMADGGEGTVTAMVAATSGRMAKAKVTGPLATMSVEAQYGILGDGVTAVIEMAAASGLALVPEARRNPLNTTTFGTGELIRHATRQGAKKIILGIGGSATTDAGIGALQAVGCRLDGAQTGRPLEGRDVSDIRGIGFVPTDLPEILIACDVDNPLYGPKGAAAIYGPQKGANPDEVRRLDDDLRSFAQRTGKDQVAQRPGSGAAGGLGFGLSAFLQNVRLAPGFDLVAEACGFDGRLKGVDLCITAEGRFDRSSLHGKTAVGVARRCATAGVKCLVLAGSVEAQAEEQFRREIGAVAMPIVDGPVDLPEAMQRTGELLERTTARAMAIAGYSNLSCGA